MGKHRRPVFIKWIDIANRGLPKLRYTKDVPVGGTANMKNLIRDYNTEENWDAFGRDLAWMQEHRSICGCAIGDPVLVYVYPFVVECTTCGCTSDSGWFHRGRPILFMENLDGIDMVEG